jgi:xanthocillin biosynthesis cytochrome P450 monooxygenase
MAERRPNKQYAKMKTLDENRVVDLLDSALEKGVINDEQFRTNIKITFLTAHENAQQLLNLTFWELSKSQVWQSSTYLHTPTVVDTNAPQDIQIKLRQEVQDLGVSNPTAETLNSMPFLTSVLYELLRLYPPVPQLINRVTTERAVLGGKIVIPKRTWVGWNRSASGQCHGAVPSSHSAMR